MKKLLSFSLALCMMVTLFAPFAVFAAGTDELTASIGTEDVANTPVVVGATDTTVTVAFWLTGITDELDIGAYGIYIKYDQTRLRMTDIYAEVGSGRNKVYYGAACFEGGFQLSEPGSATNPFAVLAWTTTKANPGYDSTFEMNTYPQALVDFEIIGDWTGETDLEFVAQSAEGSKASILRRSDDAAIAYKTVNGKIVRGETPVASSIEVSTPPTKTEYLEGKDALKLDGGKLTIHYTNAPDYTIDLAHTSVKVDGFDNTVAGPQELTVSYGGKTCKLPITITAKSATKIEVTTPITKGTYVVGQSVDPAGGKLHVVYNNGTDETIDLTPEMLEYTAKVGDVPVKVNYLGKSTTLNVTYIAKKAVSIVVTKAPAKTQYEMGENVVISDTLLTVTYNDDSVEENVALGNNLAPDFNKQLVGKQTVTISFGGVRGTLELEVLEPRVIGVAVKQNPNKTVYKEGNALDLTGGILAVTYSDFVDGVNRVEDVAMTDAGVTSSGYSATVGEKEIRVTYGGHSTTFKVSVNDKAVESIAVATPPALTVIEGMGLDLASGTLTVNYDNGTHDTVAMNAQGVTPTGFDKDALGEQTVIFNYGGKSCTLTVTVVKKSVERIEILRNPTLSYVENQKDAAFLPGNGKIKVFYNNGTDEEILMSDARVSVTGFDNTKVGTNTVTVSFGGASVNLDLTIRPKVAIEVIKVLTQPTKVKYAKGEDLDLTGGTFSVRFDNEIGINFKENPGETDPKPTVISMTDPAVKVSGYNKDTVGSQTVTLTYQNATCKVTVTVNPPPVTAIQITTLPKKLDYLEGKDALDLTGAVLTITYADSSTATADLKKLVDADKASVEGFDNTKVGPQTLTVRYTQIATLEINIVAKSASSLTLLKRPNVITYKEGRDALNLNGGRFKVLYNNGTDAEIAMVENGVSVTGFDNTKVGDQELTLTYMGLTLTFKVKVEAKKLASIEMVKLPDKVEYFKDEAIDVTGGKIKLNYDNGTFVEYDLKANWLKGDTSVVGTQTITVDYLNDNSITCTFNVTVKERSLVSVDFVTKPSKLVYELGEEINVNGGKLLLSYDNNTTEEINLDKTMVSGYDKNKAGTQTLTVTVDGKSCTYTVTVNAPAVDDTVYGDADGNGEVDLSDVIILCQYLADYDWDTGESSVTLGGTGDADGNGEVDLSDVILLCQYLADYDWDTGESSVVLGPKK